jgi:hypothetical protein
MLEGKPCQQKVPAQSKQRPGIRRSLLFFTTPRGGQLLLPGCTSWENPIDKGALQLRQVCRHLAVRPIALCDCEYGCAPFVLKTADIPADKLVRLRSNLCLWGAPPPYSGKGRPRIHGNKFQLNDPQTWGEALESLQVDDPKLGQVQIRLWRGLHFRKAANHPMLVLRVERLEPQSSGRVSKPLWLA